MNPVAQYIQPPVRHIFWAYRVIRERVRPVPPVRLSAVSSTLIPAFLSKDLRRCFLYTLP